jgi:leucyl-tRNA synthetase
MIKELYHPQEIELHMQTLWNETEAYKATENSTAEKFYCLSMFPYPSGQLHVGHVRNYVLGDVVARYQRMLGKNVLHPMGWDAFGLPAENAAIKNGVAPSKWTYENIDSMKQQFQTLGLSFDWSRELKTCESTYYRFEQWLFIKMYERGLVYRKNSVVNWDPVDQTVLANEQVVDGKGWRSGAAIERREIPQWFLKITAYADELLEKLDTLDWPDQVKTMQRHWIGRSEGTEIIFKVSNQHSILEVFTTRADTLMGATYLAIAPQHPLAELAAKDNEKIRLFVEKFQHVKVAEADMATMEKAGIDSGFKAIHPITKKEVPIWIANYVLLDYGSGAVMAVPAHDARDFEFSKKYALPRQQVIKTPLEFNIDNAAWTELGTTTHSGEFNELSSEEAKQKITAYLIKIDAGKIKTHYRLRDWGISRQRYWGTPIPFIHCEKCGILPVPELDLPVVLPEDVVVTNFTSTLQKRDDFYQVNCPQCQQSAHRETDTFDTFMESSWYFDRFTSYDQPNAILDERAKYWTPVDQYVGGVEHAVMHLLYSRFIHKVLRDLNFVNCDEPFTKLLTQGMVLKDGAKMSKSKGNVVSPQDLITKYGADTLRFFVIFTAPPEQSLEWSDAGVEGSHRFLHRVWNFAYDNTLILQKKMTSVSWTNASAEQKNIWREMNLLVKQASFDMVRLQLNTVASAAMKLLNLLNDLTKIAKKPADHTEQTTIYDYLTFEGLRILLCLLQPITPHIAEHLWEALEYGHLGKMAWPTVNEAALKTEQEELVVQINGKLRGKIFVPTEADAKTIEKLVLTDEKIQKQLEGKSVKKVIVIPHRLVNVVI